MPLPDTAEERTAREDAVASQLGVFRALLPKLLKDLGKTPDPRQPKKVKHKLTVVLLYGVLSFVLQMSSRREANRELSRPAFLATLQPLFPELESLPHADTLNRLLSELDVAHLEQAHVALLRRLIRNQKFRRYLIAQCYPIAIDGTRDTRALRPVVGGGRVGTTSGDGRRRIGAAVRLGAGSESGAA